MEVRLRPDDYFTAALELLAEGGVGALTTTNVCRRLGVTTGSLYHHFANGPAFYAAVIDYWENTVNPALQRLAEEATDPLARLEVLFNLAVHGDHGADTAIRAWANSDPMVAAAQQRIDRARDRLLTSALHDAGIDADRAATLSHIGFAILIGSQQTGQRIDRGLLTESLEEYRRWVYSLLPEYIIHPPPATGEPR